ncbi:MAG: glycosyltransferase family 4 protein [Clostridiales bacterium]|nr:glycosyltransferase family 4 protein [Clostridiales bacterium]
MIYQYVHSLKKGDAIGNEVVAIREYLLNCRIDNLIVKFAPDYPQKGTIFVDEFEKKVAPGDLLIVHYAWVLPDVIWKKMKAFPCKKIMIYHNITPGEFFAPYDKKTAKASAAARVQLSEGARIFDAAWGVSQYNADELSALGYKNVDVLPLLISFPDYQKEPNRVLMERLNDGYTNIFFVGRMVPNKCFEDIIFAFAEYKKQYDPNSRLILVGNDDLKPYVYKLQNFCRDQNIKDVLFRAHCPFSDILAYYRSADLFLCMSEHEGFCVPLLEAMVFEVPVMAYSACAVPDTLGDGGICFTDKEPSKVASIMHALLTDEQLKTAMLENQKKQLQRFDPQIILKEMLEKIRKYQD